MPDDITKGELVRVKVAGLYHGQECQVIAVEHNTWRRREVAPTWYLLDTRYAKYNWSMPAWFKPDEIEPVTPEESRGVAE